jgi:hypothetical protein
MAKIVHHEECDSFVIGIIESACEMLRCKVPSTPLFSPFCSTAVFMISFVIKGMCLDFTAEDHRVTERNAALERMSVGVETLWSDPRCRSAIVLL